jgi:quercetin dioxygenase-like cupin family protein
MGVFAQQCDLLCNLRTECASVAQEFDGRSEEPRVMSADFRESRGPERARLKTAFGILWFLPPISCKIVKKIRRKMMTFSFWHSQADETPITIPAIGLDLFVRMPSTSNNGAMTVIETINAPGFGPPRYRHNEVEVFRVLEGRYLYEVDGMRFHADVGDLVTIPGGAGHGFVNVTNRPARELIMILPGLDAARFFTELGILVNDGLPEWPKVHRVWPALENRIPGHAVETF